MRDERESIRITNLVTLWIANMAGKSMKEPLRLTHFYNNKQKPKYERYSDFMKEFDKKREEYLREKKEQDEEAGERGATNGEQS